MIAGTDCTRRFRALSHDFRVRTCDPALRRYLDEEVFAPFAVDGGRPAAEYLVWRPPGHQGRRWETWYGTERLVLADEPSVALAMLLWHINREVVARAEHLVRVHAAVASIGGKALVLPAPMESGKTTLVAALVRSGMRYLSDEVAAIDPVTLTLHAYPKALSVDPGSWRVLADLEPHVDPAVAPWLPEQWQVPAAAIRGDAVARTAHPRVVVFPRYDARSPTRLAPVARADAAVRLVHSTFGFDEHAERDLEVIGRLTGECDCYELVVGDLDAACTAVLDTLTTHRSA